MTFNKKILAGLVAFAAASSAQAVTVAANDGWELGVSGSINQFAVFTENDNGDDLAEVRDGLLPAFLNFDVKAPTMNGLDIAAHISFSPSTNASSYDSFEQREVYFTVDGSFGQILAGKALGLYGSHNILTDQSLFGVGYGSGGNGTTTLGSIGLGYDYAAWRSQIRWTSNDMNGFKLALAVVDSAGGSIELAGQPTGPIVTGNEDSDNLRYEADLSYAGTFDGGSYSAWLSAMTQDHDALADDAKAWTVGGTLAIAGFEFMAQYSDAEDATNGSAASSSTDTGAIVLTPAVASVATEWSQYIIQAGYRFAGTTLVSANYAELSNDASGAVNDTTEKYTVGVYHDVNSNLKLVAEYTSVEDDDPAGLDQEIIAIGGFVFF
jgi:predicted porin